MWRSVENVKAAGRAETWLRLAAAVLAFGPAAAVSAGTRADDPAPADRVVTDRPPVDPAVRRADARSHHGFGSMLAAPFQ